MKIDLLGGSYQDKYIQINSQRTINWYPAYSYHDQVADSETNSGSGQINRESGKEIRTLKPTPGLTLFAENAGNTSRGAFSINDRAFFVIDNSFYEVFTDHTLTLRGTLSATLGGSTTKVWMAANNNNEIMLADHQVGYIYNLATNVLTQITDIDFPGADSLTSQDNRFIVSFNGRVYWSDLNNGMSWTGVNVYTPSYKADNVKAVMSLQEEIYNFGSETLEIYFDNGETPFERVSRSSIHYGIIAPETLCLAANTILFTSKFSDGQLQVIQIAPNHELSTVSPPSITYQIGQYEHLEDMYAWTYSAPDGHIFYVLTIPSAEKSLVYDLTTKDWHEWSSYLGDSVTSAPTYGRFIGKHHLFLKGKHLVSSFKDGNIYELDWTTFTENGQPIIRQRDTQIYHAEYKYISVHELELDMTAGLGTLSGQGSTPMMMLQLSKDGGATFQSERLIRLSKRGQYNYHCKMRMLGTAKTWVLRFKVSDPIDIALIGARARGAVGGY
jgi:hypothetical protein